MRASSDSGADLPPHAAGVDALRALPGGGSSDKTTDSTTELRIVLNCYARMLEKIDELPTVVWQSRFPAARGLIRILTLRHVTRGVAALKRAAHRRIALDHNSAVAARNLELLEHFEQSLPRLPRPAVIAPLALITTLALAYFLGNYWMLTPSAKLLGDLTTAAVRLDRGAAVEALQSDSMPGGFYVGGALIVVWSLALAIMPFLPALAVKRRLFQAFAGAENGGLPRVGSSARS